MVYVKQNIPSCPTKLLSTDKENILAIKAINAQAHGFVVWGWVATTLPASIRTGNSLTTHC